MKQVRALVFDLDNTLYDCDALVERASREALVAMITAGLSTTIEEAQRAFALYITSSDKFTRVAAHFDCSDDSVIKAGEDTYYKHADVSGIQLFSGVYELLLDLGQRYDLFLLTQGDSDQQSRKIEALGIRSFFRQIFIAPVEKKEDAFVTLLDLGYDASEIVVVGDRLDKEIALGNLHGMHTVHVRFGKFGTQESTDEKERADYSIDSVTELHDLLSSKQPHIVLIGGGTGSASLISGLRHHLCDLSVIVSVSDTGRSTGKVRRDFTIPAPGDLRNCLAAFASPDSSTMKDLFSYRFMKGDYKGHTLGNLIIAALSDITGDFASAIDRASRLLSIEGSVLPVTHDMCHICAELEDGTLLSEEDAIIDRHNPHVHLRSQIKRVFLSPSVSVNPAALDAIEKADLIVLTSGSLFTSVIANLLVPGISEAIRASKAPVVYVSNIMTQPCQTTGFSAFDHVSHIRRYLGSYPDHIILNATIPSRDVLASYEQQHSSLVRFDTSLFEKEGITPHVRDVLDIRSSEDALWKKKNLLRHDSDKTSRVLLDIVDAHLHPRKKLSDSLFSSVSNKV